MKKIILLFILISTFSFGQKLSLHDKINIILLNKNATVSVSVLGFENAFKYNRNADKKLPMQSVFKFHIAAAVLDFVDKGKLSLDQKIHLDQFNLLENTWSPLRDKYPNGGVEVSLSEILELTVAKSDNNGCDYVEIARRHKNCSAIHGFKRSKRFPNKKQRGRNA